MHSLQSGTRKLCESTGTSSNAVQAVDRSNNINNDVVIIADKDVVPIESNNVIRKRCSSADLSVHDRFPIYEQNSIIGLSTTNDDAEGNCETIDEEEYAVDDNDGILDSNELQTGEAFVVSLLPGIHDVMPNDTYSQEIDGYSRPYFLYSQVIKDSATSHVGISFQNKRKRLDRGRVITTVIIGRIADDGLFGRSNNCCLCPGDEVISVNNLSATNLTANQVAKTLKLATDTISLTVRNATGDPRLLFSSVQKPSSDAMVGLALSNKCFGNSLVITRVENSGLFGTSLLMPGQRCLMINGISCRNLPSPEAVKLIHRRVSNDPSTDTNDFDNNNKPHHVTIISKISTKSYGYATVLSTDSVRLTSYQKILLFLGYRMPSFVTGGASRDGEIIAVATEVDDTNTSGMYRRRRRPNRRSRSGS